MRLRRTFQTIDTHTGGQPTRTVVGGLPVIPGSTMQEKFLHVKEEKDWIRRVLCQEPRGSEVMSGAFLTTPCTPGADIGVIYFEAAGYLPMCAHDTIGLSTALVENGIVEVTEPVTRIVLDTPAGVVQVSVEVENFCARRVTIVNAPSFVMKRDCLVETAEFGPVKLDIAWGGNTYGILPASALGLEIVPERAREIIAKAVLLRDCVNEQISVSHPTLPFVDRVTHMELYADSATSGVSARNTVLINGAALDRSACGTGTSARMALMHAKGQLKRGESFVHESILGSTFTGRIIEETDMEGIPAVIAEISGQAFLTGMSTFVIDPDDPLGGGFLLG